jgi:DNA-binding MarR family transcriptional regulator
MPTSVVDTDRALAREVFELLPRIGKVAQRAAREAAREGGSLTFERSRILHQLREGPRRSGELAQLCKLTPPAVTELVEALAQEGLVRRETDADDRRAVVIALTAQGRRELERFAERVSERLSEVLKHLDPAKRQRLRAAIADMHHAFQEFESQENVNVR